MQNGGELECEMESAYNAAPDFNMWYTRTTENSFLHSGRLNS